MEASVSSKLEQYGISSRDGSGFGHSRSGRKQQIVVIVVVVVVLVVASVSSRIAHVCAHKDIDSRRVRLCVLGGGGSGCVSVTR